MTARSTWKASERRMAGILGGERVPVTGRERGHAPDIDGVTVAGRRLAIEHKYGQAILSARVNEAFKQAKAAARNGDIPIVTIEETGHGQKNIRAVILEAAHFSDIVAWYEEQLEYARTTLDRMMVEHARKCPRCTGRIMIETASCTACGWRI